jgi:hypothetical protein
LEHFVLISIKVKKSYDSIKQKRAVQILTCKDLLDKYINVINKVIKDLELEYNLDYMLENFKSIILVVETKRTRIAAVQQIDEKKTKRIYIKVISNKLEADEKIELAQKSQIFITLYRSIKNLKELEQAEQDLKNINGQLLYSGKSYYKELGTTLK